MASNRGSYANGFPLVGCGTAKIEAENERREWSSMAGRTGGRPWLCLNNCTVRALLFCIIASSSCVREKKKKSFPATVVYVACNMAGQYVVSLYVITAKIFSHVS